MAEVKNLGAYHLSNNPALYEPARSNNFRFYVTDIDNILRAGIDPNQAQITDRITNAQELLEFSVVTASVPAFTQAVIEIRRGNSVMKVAGVPTFDSGSLKINDYIGADGKSILYAWQGLSYNVNTEKVGHLADYKKTCYLLEYDPSYKLVRQWVLSGCWISGVTADEYNMESGDKRTVTATVQYDWAKMSMPDDEEA